MFQCTSEQRTTSGSKINFKVCIRQNPSSGTKCREELQLSIIISIRIVLQSRNRVACRQSCVWTDEFFIYLVINAPRWPCTAYVTIDHRVDSIYSEQWVGYLKHNNAADGATVLLIYLYNEGSYRHHCTAVTSFFIFTTKISPFLHGDERQLKTCDVGSDEN